MRGKTHYILLFFGVFILFGCEKDINFQGKELPPKMVVNSLIYAKSDTNRIKISESAFAFSDQRAAIVENPEVRLSINGVVCNQIWQDTIIGVDTYYKFVSQLNAGDKIEFSAHTPKHGTVKGYDIVPNNTVEITNIEHSWFWKNDIQYLRLFVTIKDNPDERNYYRIVVRTNSYYTPPTVEEPRDDWALEEVFIDDEILFHKPAEPDEAGYRPNFYRIFTDDLFRGKEYTLNVYIRYSDYSESSFDDYVRQHVKVEIHTLSEKLYRNLRSQELASGTIGDLFTEPVKIYTNMQGGYGILGTYTSTEKVKLIVEKGE
jgi:hypothetical protein